MTQPTPSTGPIEFKWADMTEEQRAAAFTEVLRKLKAAEHLVRRLENDKTYLQDRLMEARASLRAAIEQAEGAKVAEGSLAWKARYETERQVNMNNTEELIRADGEIGQLKAQLRDLTAEREVLLITVQRVAAGTDWPVVLARETLDALRSKPSADACPTCNAVRRHIPGYITVCSDGWHGPNPQTGTPKPSADSEGKEDSSPSPDTAGARAASDESRNSRKGDGAGTTSATGEAKPPEPEFWRPAIGMRVRTIDTGKRGVVIEKDESSFPWIVKLDDGHKWRASTLGLLPDEESPPVQPAPKAAFAVGQDKTKGGCAHPGCRVITARLFCAEHMQPADPAPPPESPDDLLRRSELVEALFKTADFSVLSWPSAMRKLADELSKAGRP